MKWWNMLRIIKLLCIVVMFFSSLSFVHASKIYQDYQFDDSVESERFQHLLSQLRCMVCQNQSLAESDVVLAQDLRQKIYDMMQAGESDKQITDYLLQRYGEFILLSPLMTTKTYVLWIGPFVLLFLLAGLGCRMVYRIHQRHKVQS